jgi:hypothetical protein
MTRCQLPWRAGLLFLVTALSPAAIHASEQSTAWITQQQNIPCAWLNQSLRCDVYKPAWKPWGCRANGCYGSSFVLPSQGKAYLIRTSDTAWTPKATVFPNDGTTRIGTITCRSTDRQVSCANTSGGRMTLSSDRYVINR